MAQTLEYNKAVTTVTAAIVPTFDEDMAIIQKLDDEPNDVGGLTAAQLKAEFDTAGERVKQFINGELVPTIISEALTEEARALAESERVANEIERVSNENDREMAEAERAQSEQRRDSYEKDRNIAETKRENAELQRVLAEEARVNSTNGIVAEAALHSDAAANSAHVSASNAEAAAMARVSAEAAVSSAIAAADNSSAAAKNAALSKDDAADQAKMARSWAVGATGARADEDTNNARYWAMLAQNGATGVQNLMDGGSNNGALRGILSAPEDNDYSVGEAAVALGYKTKASGSSSFATGINTNATTRCAFAEGENTVASGYAAHAEGAYTIAAGSTQHVEGEFNVADSASEYLHIVGNGTSETNRKNAYTLGRDGTGRFAGDLYVGSAIKDSVALRKVATEEYVQSYLSKATLGVRGADAGTTVVMKQGIETLATVSSGTASSTGSATLTGYPFVYTKVFAVVGGVEVVSTVDFLPPGVTTLVL